jgi:nucleotide-binding universal stress UspA family protein
MPYREILVYLDPSSDSDIRLDFAIQLAATHEARLIGVDACSDAAFEGELRDRATGLADNFDAKIHLAGLRGSFRGADRERKGALLRYAHHADLIVAPQPDVETRNLIVAGVPEDVLVGAGVPLLLMPPSWKPRAVGASIFVAWKPGREATRAVHDAMPLLVKAKTVTVFTFDPESDLYGTEPDLLVHHLHEHGVAAHPLRWPNTGELSAVEAMFASLDSEDSDLIVAGAYGHSRLMEGLFGGASRDLVRQNVLPVFMSH